jgi:hypothetical protein
MLAGRYSVESGAGPLLTDIGNTLQHVPSGARAVTLTLVCTGAGTLSVKLSGAKLSASEGPQSFSCGEQVFEKTVNAQDGDLINFTASYNGPAGQTYAYAWLADVTK